MKIGRWIPLLVVASATSIQSCERSGLDIWRLGIKAVRQDITVAFEDELSRSSAFGIEHWILPLSIKPAVASVGIL